MAEGQGDSLVGGNGGGGEEGDVKGFAEADAVDSDWQEIAEADEGDDSHEEGQGDGNAKGLA